MHFRRFFNTVNSFLKLVLPEDGRKRPVGRRLFEFESHPLPFESHIPLRPVPQREIFYTFNSNGEREIGGDDRWDKMQ